LIMRFEAAMMPPLSGHLIFSIFIF
jgi:hypothetical protein